MVFVIDGGGTVLAASAEDEQLVGKNFAGHELTKELLAKDEGTTTAKDFDGTRRILGFVRVPWTNARLAVGVDESVVHSGIDREISIAYVQLGVFGMLVLLAAWFGGERLILRPIRSLARTATRFGRGDLRARAADEPWMAEFEPLAAAFDDMARKLGPARKSCRSPISTLRNWQASTASPASPTGAALIANSITPGTAPTNCASRSL